MADFHIHHFSILCEDLEESLSAYLNQLGQEVFSGNPMSVESDSMFVGKGSKVTVQLIGKPYTNCEQSHTSKHGYSIYKIGYKVDDVDRAFEELRASGVKAAWEPQGASNWRHCGLYDEDGLLFEVFSDMDSDSSFKPKQDNSWRRIDLQLQHVSILTPNLRRSQRFYEEKLGLRTVFELIRDNGGLIFLIDRAYDHRNNNFMLEIIGPPYLEPREFVLLDKQGACYDHLCYTTGDVKRTWRMVLQNGGTSLSAPTLYHGIWIAWIRDKDGIDIEIMQPIPKLVVDIALERGQPMNGSKLIQTSGVFMAHIINQSIKLLKNCVSINNSR